MIIHELKITQFIKVHDKDFWSLRLSDTFVTARRLPIRDDNRPGAAEHHIRFPGGHHHGVHIAKRPMHMHVRATDNERNEDQTGE